MDCTTADAAPSASDQVIIQQRIEGQNLQYLKKELLMQKVLH
jgi:hypothetical protein